MAFARPVTLLQSTESQFRTYAHRQRKNEYQAPFENYQPHRASARRLIGLETKFGKTGANPAKKRAGELARRGRFLPEPGAKKKRPAGRLIPHESGELSGAFR
jgi:hypothetical protein